MLTHTLDPTFQLSSDFYYRGLLSKVKESPVSSLIDLNYLRSTRGASLRSESTLIRKSPTLHHLLLMGGVSTAEDILGPYQVID